MYSPYVHALCNYPCVLFSVQVREEGEVEGEGLGLGLGYLEHVCRIMEEIAKLQICNRGLQVEMEGLREQRAKLENRVMCDESI